MPSTQNEQASNKFADFAHKHYIFAVYLIIFILWLPYFSLPFSHDESVFVNVGKGITEGKRPYSDMFDNKGPVLHLFYSILWFLFGTNSLGHRLVFFIILLASGVLINRLSKFLFPEKNPRIAEISYLLLMSIPGGLSFGMSEPIVNFLLLLAGVCAVKFASARQAFFLALAGIFASFAINTNPIAIPASFFIFWLVYEFALPKPLRLSRELLLFAIPFLLPFLLFAAYLLLSNSLGDYWQVSLINQLPNLPILNAAAFLTIAIIAIPLLKGERKVSAPFSCALFYLLFAPGNGDFFSPDFFYHRIMLFVPFFCLLLSNYLERLNTKSERTNCMLFILFTVFYINSFFVSDGGSMVYYYDNDAYGRGSISAHNEIYEKFGSEINGKELAVLGYDVSPYIYLNATNPLQYFYLFHRFSERIALNAAIQKMYAEKQKTAPFDYVLIHEDIYRAQFIPQAISESIQKGEYSLLFKREFSTPARYSEDGLKSTLLIYKRISHENNVS